MWSHEMLCSLVEFQVVYGRRRWLNRMAVEVSWLTATSCWRLNVKFDDKQHIVVCWDEVCTRRVSPWLCRTSIFTLFGIIVIHRCSKPGNDIASKLKVWETNWWNTTVYGVQIKPRAEYYTAKRFNKRRSARVNLKQVQLKLHCCQFVLNKNSWWTEVEDVAKFNFH